MIQNEKAHQDACGKDRKLERIVTYREKVMVDDKCGVSSAYSHILTINIHKYIQFMSIFVNMSMDIGSNTEESKFSELKKKLKIPKNEIEVFCENQHFAICKKSIISSFQFTPLIL